MFIARKLGDVLRLHRGYDITKAQQSPGPYPVVSSSGISSFHSEYKFDGPGVIIGRKGSLGTSFYLSGQYWPHDTTLYVEDFKGNNPRYCYYLLKTLGLERYDVGASNPTLNRNHLHELDVRVPLPVVQERVASILSAYDDLIENNTRRIAILEEVARRIFEDWFVHFRAPGCDGVPMADSAIGPVPQGWEIATLESLCSRITDGAHHSPPSVEQGPRMLSVKDMRNWGFDFSECRLISQADFDDLVRNNCRPLVGDILVAKDGANLNKHTFLIEEDLDAVILSSIAILRPGPSVEKEFLVATLKSDDVSRRIKDSRTAAAIPRIILKDFRRLPVVLPPT